MNNLIEKTLVNFDENLQQAVVSSKEVAEHFEKEHKHVLRDIETMVEKDVSKIEPMFIESSYQDSYGRNQKCYLMNRDGFSLLAMGFTGQKALEWKIKYIEAFNILEAEFNSPEKIMARALQIAQKELSTLRLENKVQQQQIAELEPKATYYDLILQCKDLLSVTEISKDYGMSARKMNQILHNLGIQFNQSGVWFLYAKYQDKGYTKTKTQNYNRPDGTQGAKTHTYWTQAGRLFIYDTLKQNGVIPMIEREVA